MPWPKKIESKNDGDKLYLKKDEIVKVQFLNDEPELYYVHFDEVTRKTSKCDISNCLQCSNGMKRQEKGSIQVMDQADGKEKTLSGTAALFLAIKEVFDICGGRKGFVFSIKATGDKSQRRYHVVPLPAPNIGTSKTEELVDESPFE